MFHRYYHNYDAGDFVLVYSKAREFEVSSTTVMLATHDGFHLKFRDSSPLIYGLYLLSSRLSKQYITVFQ